MLMVHELIVNLCITGTRSPTDFGQFCVGTMHSYVMNFIRVGKVICHCTNTRVYLCLLV